MSRRKKMKKLQLVKNALSTSLCPDEAPRKEKIDLIKAVGVNVHIKASKERFEKAMAKAREIADGIIESESYRKKQSNKRKRARKAIQKSAA